MTISSSDDQGMRRGRHDPIPMLPGATPQRADSARQGAVMVLGPEVDVVGSIYIDRPVRLEGTIDGEIRCAELDVTRRGLVRGRIVADRVVVHGTVREGEIYARVLVLRPGCKVEAAIYHEQLSLEQGSYFEGKSRRVPDPIALAPAE